ncbi:MAG: hypothetical protein FWC28_07505 [Proteobacteria bacterium]|nr:hypothetical protein [Cystobacterineae bacterium]MCL2258303.1 hypothetical protein [Cystobacterineae bacterium]MCL2315077.1 hypothetical protein [Pseudomonadota bacterium]
MKKNLLWVGIFGLGLAALGCRTHIPVAVQKPPPEVAKRTTCSVRDYASAVALPSGSRDLGRVEIPRQEEEENTYLMLHQKVCDMGGDALSGMRWEVDLGQPKPRALSGNAWKLP